jgi:hypothetical protein
MERLYIDAPDRSSARLKTQDKGDRARAEQHERKGEGDDSNRTVFGDHYPDMVDSCQGENNFPAPFYEKDNISYCSRA